MPKETTQENKEWLDSHQLYVLGCAIVLRACQVAHIKLPQWKCRDWHRAHNTWTRRLRVIPQDLRRLSKATERRRKIRNVNTRLQSTNEEQG
jgi:hypothetical protein